MTVVLRRKRVLAGVVQLAVRPEEGVGEPAARAEHWRRDRLGDGDHRLGARQRGEPLSGRGGCNGSGSRGGGGGGGGSGAGSSLKQLCCYCGLWESSAKPVTHSLNYTCQTNQLVVIGAFLLFSLT